MSVMMSAQLSHPAMISEEYTCSFQLLWTRHNRRTQRTNWLRYSHRSSN